MYQDLQDPAFHSEVGLGSAALGDRFHYLVAWTTVMQIVVASFTRMYRRTSVSSLP